MRVNITKRESDAIKYAIEHLINSSREMNIQKYKRTILTEAKHLYSITQKLHKRQEVAQKEKEEIK